MKSVLPLATAPAAPVTPGLDAGTLRHAVGTLAHARVQAAQQVGGVGSRRRDEGDALGGDAGAEVAREVAAFAYEAQRHGVPIADVLLAVHAAVRAAWGPVALGPRETVVRDASRYCVKAFYEARAAAESTPVSPSGPGT
jgi:hypothetical protein